MIRTRVRRNVVVLAGALSLGLISASCATPLPYGGPPTATRTFRAITVTVNSSNDGCFLFCPYKDEPKVINIGFRVRMGVANSAAGQVSIGANHWNGVFEQGPGEGQSHTYLSNEQGTSTFAGVAMPDLLDLAQGAPLEIAGVWAWKVEDDGILAANVNNIADAMVPAIKAALNQTLAVSAVPNNANQIVSAIVAAIGNLGFFNLFATVFTGLLNNLNIASDDVVGSAMYVGVGSSGSLAGIIDGVLGGVAFPSVVIPTLVVPPDIGGGKIFSLGTGTKSFTDASTNGGVDGQHTTTYTFG